MCIYIFNNLSLGFPKKKKTLSLGKITVFDRFCFKRREGNFHFDKVLLLINCLQISFVLHILVNVYE